MIDLSGANKGELGKDTFFSDLYASATLARFTGAILVRAPRDQAIFFRGGVPVHASGQGFDEDYLGEILIRDGAVSPEALGAALEKQEHAQGQRPLIGLLLTADAGVSRDALKRAVITQTQARTISMFSIVEGTWQSAPGENARLKEIGVPIAATNLLVSGLKLGASDEELRAMSDALLGRAIQVSGFLPEQIVLDEHDRQVLKYLEKPRKPDQLERAGRDRRLVRAILRLLLVLDKARLCPASQGIPIPKATRIGGSSAPSHSTGDIDMTPTPSPPPPTPTPLARQKIDINLMAEARALHAGLGEKTHFEILGIPPQSSKEEVRKAYTSLQKKYHPDTFLGVEDEEITRIVRDLSARMNEAYNALSNDKTRAEYEALLASDFKGDARKQERSRDAETKHQMGLVMLRKKDYQKAREYFNFSVQQDPDNGEYKASLAWAIFADPKMDREEATAKAYGLLLESLKGKPSATTHFYTGQVLKAKNKLDEALYHFQKASKMDPKFSDAQREVRLLSSRKKKGHDDDDDGGGGLLNKLFKR